MTRTLHIAHDGAGVDLKAAARAAADFLAALGVAIENEDLRAGRRTELSTSGPRPAGREGAGR